MSEVSRERRCIYCCDVSSPSLDTALAKLARSAYPVTTMQDLGGCRAILSSVRDVEAVLQTFVGPPTLFPVDGKPRVDNYMLKPKPDGYRGVHIVGRYRPNAEKTVSWNG
jgi:ppGpp synthetase/RelA/SpoT-type nucleotidyltranferase